MTAEAERAIRCDFAGLARQHLENLGHHDGAVTASGVLPAATTFATSAALRAELSSVYVSAKRRRFFPA